LSITVTLHQVRIRDDLPGLEGGTPDGEVLDNPLIKSCGAAGAQKQNERGLPAGNPVVLLVVVDVMNFFLMVISR
jgi:hypothetical protein